MCLLAYNSPDVKIDYLCHFIYQMTFHYLVILNYSFYLSRTHIHYNKQSTVLGNGVEEEQEQYKGESLQWPSGYIGGDTMIGTC